MIPDAREFPAGGAINWTNGFLPARHQGVVIRPQGEPIDDLFPARPVGSRSETGTRELVAAMNRSHIARHPGDDALSARIRGYEMAARMQISVPLVADLNEENRGDPVAVRNRPQGICGFRPGLPALAAAARTRRPVRADLLGRHLRQPAPKLGRA